jgi:hypothetical protein
LRVTESPENSALADYPIDRVEVKCQSFRIDVLVRIDFTSGKSVSLVIEDKIHAGDYNDLNTYVEKAGAADFCKDSEIHGVFLRTGSQAFHTKAKKSGFGLFTRANFSHYFQSIKKDGIEVADTVFNNWKTKFEEEQAELDAYRNTLLADWGAPAYIGYYQHLIRTWKDEEKGCSKVGGWRLVNPDGGNSFLGLWTKGFPLGAAPEYNLYALVQPGAISIRTGGYPTGKEHREHRKRYRNGLYAYMNEQGVLNELNLRKVKKFGSGESMELCRLDFSEPTAGLHRHEDLSRKLTAVYGVLGAIGEGFIL